MTELVRGSVVEVPFGTTRHGALCSSVAARLIAWSPRHSKGSIFLGRVGVVTNEAPATLRGPDVVFCSRDDSASEDDWLREPELVVEVQDRHETGVELHAKSVEYLEAGVGEVWVLDGPTRQLRVHRGTSEDPLVLTEWDELTSPQLPGFACKVADLLAAS